MSKEAFEKIKTGLEEALAYSAHERGLQAAYEHLEGYPDIDRVRTIISAYLEASGLVLVPREPTDEMCQETADIVTHVYGGDYNGYMDPETARSAYACMIAAAPKPL